MTKTSAFPRIFIGSLITLTIIGAFASAILFAHAQTGPTIASGILNASNATTTTAQVGTIVHESALVGSTTGPTPTGTVDFNLYPNTSCTGSPVTQSGVALVNGAAISATTAVPASGLSYKVHYNGQADVYPSIDGTCDSLVATSATTGITTTLSSTSVVVGTAVHDSSVLSGATSDATGTVSYSVYSDNACTTLFQGPNVKNVSAHVVPDSDPLTINTTGTYYWQASYSGDLNNIASKSTCGSEVLTVTPTPTPATAHLIVDKVTNPSADQTSFHFTTSGSGYSGFNLADQSTPNDQILAPGTYTVSEDSMSNWTLSTSMCAKNGATSTAYTPGTNITLAGGDTVTCVFTNTKNSTTTTATSTGMISGEKFNDANGNGVKDSGETGLSGWSITLTGTTNENTSYTWHGHHYGQLKHNKVTLTTTTDANGNYSFSNLLDGTYTLREVAQTGWKQETKNPKPVTIKNGNTVTGIDFGNMQIPTPGSGSGATSTPCEGQGNGNGNGNGGWNGNGNGNGGPTSTPHGIFFPLFINFPQINPNFFKNFNLDFKSNSKVNGDNHNEATNTSLHIKAQGNRGGNDR